MCALSGCLANSEFQQYFLILLSREWGKLVSILWMSIQDIHVGYLIYGEQSAKLELSTFQIPSHPYLAEFEQILLKFADQH